MKQVCVLDKTEENFAWCFDCVPEVNSLLLGFDGVNLNVKSFVERGHIPHEEEWLVIPEASGFSASHVLEYSFSASAVAQSAGSLDQPEYYDRLVDLSGAGFVMASIGLFDVKGLTGPTSSFQLCSPAFGRITIKLDSDYYSGQEIVIDVKNNAPDRYYLGPVKNKREVCEWDRYSLSHFDEGSALQSIYVMKFLHWIFWLLPAVQGQLCAQDVVLWVHYKNR